MESQAHGDAASEVYVQPERPQSLKTLCILSFVGCGIMLLLYAFGTMFLTLSSATIATFWETAVASNPQLENIDPVEFCHQFGMVCVYGLIATIFSLVGVIMMWRLEKIGFFIYAIAEIATNFFTINIQPEEEKSYGGTVFFILIDLVFIVLYFVNLKYMHKKNNNTFIQSGS